MSDSLRGSTGRKRTWLAVVLAILYPGLGHVYLRKWGRALLWFVMIVTSSVFLIPEGASPATMSIDALVSAAEAIPAEVSLLILGLSFLSVLDAYWQANQINEKARPTVDEGGEIQAENCPNCGKELDEDLEFCPWCSQRLVEPEDGEESPD